MADADQPAPQTPSRFWLFAPFVILGLAAIAWTAAWFVISARTGEALDAWVGAEAIAGRKWTCADRSVGGYPFRIEVSCATLSLERGDLKATLGRVLSVAQVYQPRHVITEVGGPLRASDGRLTVEGRWSLLQASVQTTPNAFQRLSVVMDGPAFRVAGLTPVELALASQRFEAHIRPDPARAETDGAYDVALSAAKAVVPSLDEWIGGGEPSDIAAEATVTQARGISGRPLVEEVERWRRANGSVVLGRLSVDKGARRLEARGELGLDELHRVRGRLDASASGLEGLLGTITSGRAGTATAILGALLGPSPAPPAPSPRPGATRPALSPLPTLAMENGRLMVGPFPVPGMRLPPLY